MINKILSLYLRNILNLPSQVNDFVSDTLRPLFRHDHRNDLYTVSGITARFAFAPNII